MAGHTIPGPVNFVIVSIVGRPVVLDTSLCHSISIFQSVPASATATCDSNRARNNILTPLVHDNPLRLYYVHDVPTHGEE